MAQELVQIADAWPRVTRISIIAIDQDRMHANGRASRHIPLGFIPHEHAPVTGHLHRRGCPMKDLGRGFTPADIAAQDHPVHRASESQAIELIAPQLRWTPPTARWTRWR